MNSNANPAYFPLLVKSIILTRVSYYHGGLVPNPREDFLGLLHEPNRHNSTAKELECKVKEDKADKPIRTLTHLLFDSALFTSGCTLDKQKSFTKRTYRMTAFGLDVEGEKGESMPRLASEAPAPALTSAMEEIG